MQLDNDRILLLGLPGAGKTRVAKSLNSQFDCALITPALFSDGKNGCLELKGSFTPLTIDDRCSVWCVIDIRSNIERDQSWVADILKQYLSIADGVVFSFAEQADLSQQTQWGSWLKKTAEELGCEPFKTVRWFYQQFPQEFAGFSSRRLSVMTQFEKFSFEVLSHEFEVGTVMLDHLLMGLDNSRRNLGMKITRVQANLNTFEFDNKITVEGTPYRLDKFAAEEGAEVGKITVSGLDLDREWLEQIIKASVL